MRVGGSVTILANWQAVNVAAGVGMERRALSAAPSIVLIGLVARRAGRSRSRWRMS
jgi:hypothetical protein